MERANECSTPVRKNGVPTAPAAVTPKPEPVAPEPDFAIEGARALRHAAAPMLALDLRISDQSGCRST